VTNVRAAAISHDKEQGMVRAFFNGVREGFFVEVGANDPFERSQTWHLERLGWTGVLIEPQPDLAVKLVKKRKSMVFAAACSSPQQAGGMMPLHVAGPLSGLDRARMAPGAEPQSIIDVPVRTLDDILAEANAPSPIDFLSIDVEGHELEVLHGFDFARWKPRLIMMEDHVGSLAKHWYLQSSGYRLIRRVGNNGWYVPAGTQIKIRWGERWEIWRKYYLALPVRLARNGLRAARRAIKDR
jgi:FkbM family methyltransferase